MLQALPRFYAHYSNKTLFISTNSFNQKYIVSQDYCIAHHNDNTCFLPNCKYHLLLVGDIETLLGKLDSFCFIYQHVDCLYTLFKYRFCGNVIEKNGNLFNDLQRAVLFNQGNKKGAERLPSIAKKRLLRKKYKNHLMSSLQATKSTQTMGSLFAERIRSIKKTKYEGELIKIVDCFLDGYGNYDSNLVSFRIKSFIH